EWLSSRDVDWDRISLAGFSQPCSFNYRVALDPPHGRPFRCVLGFCGGIPGEWAEGKPTVAAIDTRVLHVSTREDPFYPLDRVASFQDSLGSRFAHVEHRL